jgi:hypothetical protein
MNAGIVAALSALTLCLLLGAGCTTTGPASDQQTGSGLSGSGTQAAGLNLNEPARLANGSWSVTAAVSELDTSSSKPGRNMLDIYIRATNTGTKPVLLAWYSKITTPDGKSYGGIGVSHAGSGAHTPPLSPGSSATVRDYIVVESDQDFAALSNGATLDVVITAQESESSPAVALFTASWAVGPGRIR